MIALAIGSIVTDVVFLLLNYNNQIFVSKQLTRWYTELGPAAMAADVLIILVVVMLGVRFAEARFKAPTIWQAAGVVVGFQLMHDLLFYLCFSKAPPGNYILDVFKTYSDEVGVHALWSDSLMVLSTLFIANQVSQASGPNQHTLLILAVYAAIFALYSKRPTPPS